MRTLPLGNTGVEVSEFCLGAMRFASTNSEEVSV